MHPAGPNITSRGAAARDLQVGIICGMAARAEPPEAIQREKGTKRIIMDFLQEDLITYVSDSHVGLGWNQTTSPSKASERLLLLLLLLLPLLPLLGFIMERTPLLGWKQDKSDETSRP